MEEPERDQGGEGNQGEGPAEGDDVEQVEAGDTGGADQQTEVERAAEREERAQEG